MNKRILLISGILLTLGLSFLGLYNVNNNDRLIVENDKSNNRVVSSNALTMMYETEAGSGEYQVASDTTCHKKDMFLMQNCLDVKMVAL